MSIGSFVKVFNSRGHPSWTKFIKLSSSWLLDCLVQPAHQWQITLWTDFTSLSHQLVVTVYSTHSLCTSAATGAPAAGGGWGDAFLKQNKAAVEATDAATKAFLTDPLVDKPAAAKMAEAAPAKQSGWGDAFLKQNKASMEATDASTKAFISDPLQGKSDATKKADKAPVPQGGRASMQRSAPEGAMSMAY